MWQFLSTGSPPGYAEHLRSTNSSSLSTTLTLMAETDWLSPLIENCLQGSPWRRFCALGVIWMCQQMVYMKATMLTWKALDIAMCWLTWHRVHKKDEGELGRKTEKRTDCLSQGAHSCKLGSGHLMSAQICCLLKLEPSNLKTYSPCFLLLCKILLNV